MNATGPRTMVRPGSPGSPHASFLTWNGPINSRGGVARSLLLLTEPRCRVHNTPVVGQDRSSGGAADQDTIAH